MRTKRLVGATPYFLMALAAAVSPSVAADPSLQEIEQASSNARRQMQFKALRLTLDEYTFRLPDKNLVSFLTDKLAKKDFDEQQRARLTRMLEVVPTDGAPTVRTTYSCDGVAKVYKAVSVPMTNGALDPGNARSLLACFDAKGKLLLATLQTAFGQQVLSVDRHINDRPGSSKPHVNAGIVEPDFFRMAKESGAQPVTFENDQGKSLVRINCTHSGMKVVVVLDPALEYRMISMEGRTTNGRRFVREELGDYIEQEGILFPSSYHIVRSNPATGQVVSEKRFKVIDADLNASFAESGVSLAIPANTLCLDSTALPAGGGGFVRRFTTKTDRALTGQDLAAAGDPKTKLRLSEIVVP